jgi:hypothetical protein
MISRSQIMRQMFVVALTAAAYTVVAATAHADSSKQGIEKIQEEFIERAAALNAPLTGGRMPILSGSVDEEFPVSHTAPPTSHEIPKLPPMKGFQQMADSPVMKKMLKKLITAEVPVMYQTMMMVENGAATGFIGSMNTVSNLMSNTVQSQQFQLELFDAAVSDNEHKRAYVQSAFKSQSEDRQNQDIWPSALFFASGDVLPGSESEPVPNIKKFEKFTKNPRKSGSSPHDLAQTGSNGGAKASTATPPATSVAEYKLSEIIFKPQDGETQAPTALSEFKRDLTEYVGDYGFKSNEKNGTDKVQHILTAPTKGSSGGTSTSGGTSSDPKLGYKLKLKETQDEVWKKLNEVMLDYCKFNWDDENYDKLPFDKQRASSKIQPEQWKLIQARDFNITVNIVEQYFKLFFSQQIEESECAASFNPEGDFPARKTIEKDSGSFDTCKGDKICLRKTVLIALTEFVSKSRTEFFFLDLWRITAMRASIAQNFVREAQYLFCANLQLGMNGVGYDGKPICDPAQNFEARITRNNQRWWEFIEKLGTLAQGQGGTGVFRPSSSNLSGVANP